MTPDDVARFRHQMRATGFPPAWYRGWMHFGWANVGSLVLIGGALAVLDSPSWLELTTVPATFLFANLVEHVAHRRFMHRPRRGLWVLYERHTLCHHRFYTHETMAAEEGRDWYMVLFPPWALLLMAAGLAPLTAGLVWGLSADTGALFLATGMAYFLSYEWLHLAYHLDPDGIIGRNPVVARLRAHHQTHHDPRKMGRVNFNVTFPIFDTLLGTTWKGQGRSSEIE